VFSLIYFQKLYIKFTYKPSFFKTTTNFLAFHNTSLLNGRSGKPHTIGEELILPAVREVYTVVHKSPGLRLDEAILLVNEYLLPAYISSIMNE